MVVGAIRHLKHRLLHFGARCHPNLAPGECLAMFSVDVRSVRASSYLVATKASCLHVPTPVPSPFVQT